ncbi:MAG: hypothetical protein D0530_04925 [Methylococcales bacterium]|nr:MAG: hypothetical protein D0530_04925 [Methylococcales bacterium]
METITKDQEKQILDGLKVAIKQANAGVAPSTAIAKVASDLGFGKDFTLRMVEAFNVSKTLKHYKEASGTERAESFAIADPVEVLSEMYPQNVATPGHRKEAEFVPLEVLAKEATYFDTTRDVIPLHSGKEVHTYGQADINHLLSRAYGESDRLQKRAEAARLELSISRNKMLTAVDKMAEYFRQFGHAAFNEVEAHLLSKDAAAKHVLNIVYTTSNAAALGEKRASVVKQSTSPKMAEVDALYAKIVATTDAYISSARVANSLQKEAEACKQGLQARVSFLSKSGALLDSVKDIGMISEMKKKPNAGSIQQKAISNVLDPKLETEYKNIDAQLMLSDLMKNDPVIKRHDPHKVLTAYNEVAQVTPRLSESPMMMRTVLRRYLEGDGVDTFEAKNLLDVENQMKKRDEPGTDYKYLLTAPGAGKSDE